jgi:hypothetical protein
MFGSRYEWLQYPNQRSQVASSRLDHFVGLTYTTMRVLLMVHYHTESFFYPSVLSKLIPRLRPFPPFLFHQDSPINLVGPPPQLPQFICSEPRTALLQSLSACSQLQLSPSDSHPQPVQSSNLPY